MNDIVRIDNIDFQKLQHLETFTKKTKILNRLKKIWSYISQTRHNCQQNSSIAKCGSCICYYFVYYSTIYKDL